MTPRAILGLFVLNGFYLSVGMGVLWGLRGWRWWTELVRLAGVAYLLGVASLMVLLTFEVVIGLPFRPETVVATGVLLVVAGIASGRYSGRATPSLRPRSWSWPRLSLASSLLLAGIVVYLEAAFRAARLRPLMGEFDGMVFWVPKGLAMYFFGGFAPEALRLPGYWASYPPGMPLLHAMSFESMGSADFATFHLQYWFLAVGFLAALTGLLAGRVRQEILLPILLLLLVMPSYADRLYQSRSDVMLGYLVATASVLVVLWLEERSAWQLSSATLLLAAAALTKREGILFAACVLAAALAASWRERSTTWRPVIFAGLIAVGLSLSWRVWFVAHRLPSDSPEAGYVGSVARFDQVLPTLRLVGDTLANTDHWLVVPFLAAVAAALSYVSGARRTSVFTATFAGLAIGVTTWGIWSNPSSPLTQTDRLNPVERLTGTLVLALGVLTPLLLESAWRNGAASEDSRVSTLGRAAAVIGAKSTAFWAVVALAFITYPASMLVGYSGKRLPGGPPPFRSVGGCVERPAPDRVRVVFGYEQSYRDALALRDQARARGFDRVGVAQDGCGRLRVSIETTRSLSQAMRIMRRARATGLTSELEAPSGLS